MASLIASRRAERARRGPHGYTMEEAMDPANQFAFTAGRPKRDWAMAALNAAQDAYYSENPKAKGDSSLVWDVQRRG